MGKGRPEKLTPEVQQKIIEAITAGNYNEVAARYAGIAESTFYHWMQKGEEAQSGAHKEFSEAVKNAQAKAEVAFLEIIQEAAAESWQAAAWCLERKSHARWGRKVSQEVTGPNEGPVQFRVVYDEEETEE